MLIEEIKEHITLTKAAEIYNLRAIPAEGRTVCPFCGSSSAFKTYKNRYFKCYRCGVQGSVFDLLITAGVFQDFSSALKDLSRHLDNSNERQAYIKRAKTIQKIYDVYKEIARNNQEVVEEYAESRGWRSLPDVGLALGDHCLKDYGISELELHIANMETDYGKEYYNNHLVFPLYNGWGQLVHFSARNLNPNAELRWKSSKGPVSIDNYFYNSHHLYKNPTNSDYLILCEGVSDAVSLQQLGDLPVIAQMGVNMRLVSFAEQFSKFSYIIFMFDKDRYGLGTPNAGEYKSWGQMMPHVIDLLSIVNKPGYYLMTPNLPGVKDIGEWLEYINYDLEEYLKHGQRKVEPIADLAIKMYQKNPSKHELVWRLLSSSNDLNSAKKFLQSQNTTAEEYLLNLFKHRG